MAEPASPAAPAATKVTLSSEDDIFEDDAVFVEQDRRSLTLKAGGTAVGLGEPILASGKHTWTVRVNESFQNWGDGILIGVANGDIDTPGEKAAWGIYTMTGHVHSGHIGKPGSQGKQICEPLHGRAKGATITVDVDLEKGSLAFSVNDGEQIDAGVHLSSQVRPWVQMVYQGDSVSLVR